MPSVDELHPKRRKPLPGDLSDVDRLLLERQDDGFESIERAIRENTRMVETRMPGPFERRAVIAGSGLFLTSVFVALIYLVTLVAQGRGIDTGTAAESTGTVIKVTHSATQSETTTATDGE